MAQVTLAWSANTEADLAGYRLYTAQAAGGYTTSYTNIPLTSLATPAAPQGVYAIEEGHFCAVTAYDASGNESPKSSEVQVPMLPPQAPQQLRVVSVQ